MRTAELFKLNFVKKNIFFGGKKYFSSFLVVAGAIILGMLMYAYPANAGIGDSVAGIVLDHLIYPLIYLIFYILFYIAWVVAWIGANSISVMLNPAIINAVLTHPALYEGWIIFRDVANLLFILILLLVAMGTIFRSDSYNIKKSLYKFILIIFLINFSYMIAGLFIDFGNMLMYGVLKAMCVAGSNTCFQDFFSGLMGVVDKFGDTYTLSTFLHIDAQAAVGMAIATIYTFIYGLILVALGLFLMIRVAALAILLILAPLAFFGYTAPGLEGFKNKWWDNLIQYVMFGPIFALMLYVSGLLATITITIPAGAITSNAQLGNLGVLMSTIIVNIIPLIFLLGIIPVTRAFGIAGSGAILGATTGVAAFTGAYLGSAADRWMARGAQDQRKGVMGKLNRTRAYLSPGAIKRAWKAKSAEQEHDYDAATGQMRDIHRPKMLGGRETHYKDIANRNDVARRIKDFATENGDEIVDMFKNATDIRDQQVLLKMGAAQGVSYKMAATQKDALGVNYTEDAEGYNRFYNEKIKPRIGETEAAKLGEDIGDLEDKKGNKGLKNLGHYNNTTSKWETYNYNDPITGAVQKAAHRADVVKSVNRSNVLSFMKDLRASSFYSYNAAGNKEWNETGTDSASYFLSTEGLKHVDKIKPDEKATMKAALGTKRARVGLTPDETALEALL